MKLSPLSRSLAPRLVFFLIAQRRADFARAAVRVSGLELGGLAGSLLAGKISDRLVARRARRRGHVGRRLLVVRAYLGGVALALLGLRAVPAAWARAQWAIVFATGFFLYGPQMLIGLCGAEIVGRDSVGASEGFLGWIAYMGAAAAGFPLSVLVKRFGWDIFFRTLLTTCAGAFLLLSTISNAQSASQREQAAIAGS